MVKSFQVIQTLLNKFFFLIKAIQIGSLDCNFF